MKKVRNELLFKYEIQRNKSTDTKKQHTAREKDMEFFYLFNISLHGDKSKEEFIIVTAILTTYH